MAYAIVGEWVAEDRSLAQGPWGWVLAGARARRRKDEDNLGMKTNTGRPRHTSHAHIPRPMFLIKCPPSYVCIPLKGPACSLLQKRVTEIERMRRNNTFSVEMCTEVLDPNAAKYEEQGKEMDYQKEQMEDKVQALRERADAACEIFQEIEDALNEMGYKFVHPKILMAEIMVDGTAHIMERCAGRGLAAET